MRAPKTLARVVCNFRSCLRLLGERDVLTRPGHSGVQPENAKRERKKIKKTKTNETIKAKRRKAESPAVRFEESSPRLRFVLLLSYQNPVEERRPRREASPEFLEFFVNFRVVSSHEALCPAYRRRPACADRRLSATSGRPNRRISRAKQVLRQEQRDQHGQPRRVKRFVQFFDTDSLRRSLAHSHRRHERHPVRGRVARRLVDHHERVPHRGSLPCTAHLS